MILKGQKRKLPSEDVEVPDQCSPLWESQRQFVFSVSLNKYQRSQELAEPSLRRSVLIANTLRQISLEECGAPSLEREDSQPPSSSLFSLQAKEQEGLKHHSVGMADESCTAPSCCPVVSVTYVSSNSTNRSLTNCHSGASNVPVEDEDWGSMSTESDFSLSAAISSILTALDSTIDGSPQAATRIPLRSLENLSGAPEESVALAKQETRDYSISWDQQAEGKVRGGTMEPTRTSHIEDVMMEDLFQDIDTSQLQRDMGVLGLRSNGGEYSAGDELIRYLPPFSPPVSPSHPFSLSLNSSLKCLPSFSSFSPLSSSSSPPSQASTSFPGQNQVRDGFELEQLMEILVES